MPRRSLVSTSESRDARRDPTSAGARSDLVPDLVGQAIGLSIHLALTQYFAMSGTRLPVFEEESTT